MDHERRFLKADLQTWLSPKQLAAHWGLKEDSAERWIAQGLVPKKYIRRRGKGRILIDPAVIPILQAQFDAAHRSPKGRITA